MAAVSRPQERQQARACLASSHASLAEFDEALKQARGIEFGYTHSFVLNRIALAMVHHGDRAEAEDLAGSIQDEKQRINTFVTMSLIARKNGNLLAAARLSARAVLYANELKIPLDKAFVLADLAMAQAESGEVEAARTTLSEAVAIAAQIVDPWARARALSKAASSLVVINGI